MMARLTALSFICYHLFVLSLCRYLAFSSLVRHSFFTFLRKSFELILKLFTSLLWRTGTHTVLTGHQPVPFRVNVVSSCLFSFSKNVAFVFFSI